MGGIMITGIYKLNFNNTDKVYIGQSLGIEGRIRSHISNFTTQKGASKLLEAHTVYGYRSYDVVLECAASELDNAEVEAIEIFNSINNGFNTIPGASVPCNYGSDNGYSKYTQEQYYAILKGLINKTAREVAESLGVSIYVVRHIAALEAHQWLEEEYPYEYSLLRKRKEIKHNFGKTYPQLRSPSGIIYTVHNVTQFALEHDLLQPKVSDLLHGHRKVHKGWTMVSDEQK